MYQLWGGCFEEEPSSVLRRLNDSLAVDTRLFREDVQGSRCWAAELHRSGHLSAEDNKSIQEGLNLVLYDLMTIVKSSLLISGYQELPPK